MYIERSSLPLYFYHKKQHMKKMLFTIPLLTLSLAAFAQIDIGGKVKNKVNERIDQKTDQAIDKGLDEAENSVKKKDKDKSKSSKEETAPDGKQSTQTSTSTASTTPDAGKKQDLVSYGKYDFVPAEKIIFEDHVEGETAGEFPSKWDLLNGKVEIAQVNGEQAIAFLEGNYASITPYWKTADDYLPDMFTFEFDMYVKEGGYNMMHIDFSGKERNYEVLGDLTEGASTGATGSIVNAQGDFKESFFNGWHHIALAYNKGNIKIYTDQYRLCNLPRSTGNPTGITFGCIASPENPVFIKNIRIAEGGGDLYKRIATEGKIVTHGILFDVNKADIKPTSMGTLNEITSLLKNNPDLKFSIEGHTDSDGDDAANMKLSQQRAESVKKQLVSMGIDASRLSCKGFGESKPMDNNTSPEGKANNRRVEFVKM